MNLDIWTILGIVAIILLIIYWFSKNSIWGGLTLGIIVGFILAIFFAFKGTGWDWNIIIKSGIVGTMTGFFAEMLGKLSYPKHKSK